MRVAAGVVAGLASGALQRSIAQPEGSIAILVLVFLVTIGLARALLPNHSKAYYHGIGSYVIWWFVSYVAYLSVAFALSAPST